MCQVFGGEVEEEFLHWILTGLASIFFFHPSIVVVVVLVVVVTGGVLTQLRQRTGTDRWTTMHDGQGQDRGLFTSHRKRAIDVTKYHRISVGCGFGWSFII